MRIIKAILLLFIFLAGAQMNVCLPLYAAEAGPVAGVETPHDPAAAPHVGEHSEGLPAAAPQFDLGFFKVTNSMILTWIVALFLIIFAQRATRQIKDVPEG